MRKILFFVLLLVVFLLALVADRNVLQESRTARSTTVPPDIRDDNVLEIILGHPDGGRDKRTLPPGSLDAPRGGSREITDPGTRPPGNGSRKTDSKAARPDPDAARTVPTPPPETAPQPRLKKYYYEVEEGDTLTGIAKKLFNDESKVRELKEWNELQNPHYIQAGQRLRYYK